MTDRSIRKEKSKHKEPIVYWFSVNWNFPCFELVLNDNPNRRIKSVRTERAIRLRRK